MVRAADALALSQPAVSKKLRELEDMLGVELLNRHRKGVELTRFGELFLRHALNSTDALREGISRVSAASRVENAPVVLGVLPTVSRGCHAGGAATLQTVDATRRRDSANQRQ